MVSLSCRPRGRIAQRFSLRLLQSIDAAPGRPALAGPSCAGPPRRADAQLRAPWWKRTPRRTR